MKYIKLFESFESGIEEISNPLLMRDLIGRFKGHEPFNNRERNFFIKIFVKGKKFDFYKMSKLKASRVSVHLMCPPSNKELYLIFHKYKDDYYSIRLSTPDRERLFVIDSYDDLVYFINNKLLRLYRVFFSKTT